MQARIHEIEIGEFFRYKAEEDPERIYERIGSNKYHCVGYFKNEEIIPHSTEKEVSFFGKIREFSFNRNVAVTRM